MPFSKIPIGELNGGAPLTDEQWKGLVGKKVHFPAGSADILTIMAVHLSFGRGYEIEMRNTTRNCYSYVAQSDMELKGRLNPGETLNLTVFPPPTPAMTVVSKVVNKVLPATPAPVGPPSSGSLLPPSNTLVPGDFYKKHVVWCSSPSIIYQVVSTTSTGLTIREASRPKGATGKLTFSEFLNLCALAPGETMPPATSACSSAPAAQPNRPSVRCCGNCSHYRFLEGSCPWATGEQDQNTLCSVDKFSAAAGIAC